MSSDHLAPPFSSACFFTIASFSVCFVSLTTVCVTSPLLFPFFPCFLVSYISSQSLSLFFLFSSLSLSLSLTCAHLKLIDVKLYTVLFQ